MNCDLCCKILTEEDTHEHILCTSCMSARETLHCSRCKCVLKLHTKFSRVVDKIKNQKRLVILIGVLALLIAMIAPFHPMIALKLTLGLIGLPLFCTIVIGALWVIFPGTYKVGSWLNKHIGLELADIDEGPSGLWRWVLGMFLYTFPFIFYVVGGFIFEFISQVALRK